MLLAEIVKSIFLEAFPPPKTDLYHVTSTSCITDSRLIHPEHKALIFNRILSEELMKFGNEMVSNYGGKLILVKLLYKNVNKYLWREGESKDGDFLYTFSDIDRNDIEIIKL